MKNTLWPWAIKNTIAILCCTALAVYFSKWWIIFFALLFCSDIRSVKQYFRICDKCGKRSPMAESYNKAIDMAIKAGWEHTFIDDRHYDYCPECKNKERDV